MRQGRPRREAATVDGKADGSTAIRGVIIPVSWDEKGNPVAAAIAGADEQEYLIEDNEKGRELLAHMRKEVEVKGSTREIRRGRFSIRVMNYKFKEDKDWV